MDAIEEKALCLDHYSDGEGISCSCCHSSGIPSKARGHISPAMLHQKIETFVIDSIKEPILLIEGSAEDIFWRYISQEIELNKWLIANNFPEGYDVLCVNCHAIVDQYGFCNQEAKYGPPNEGLVVAHKWYSRERMETLFHTLFLQVLRFSQPEHYGGPDWKDYNEDEFIKWDFNIQKLSDEELADKIYAYKDEVDIRGTQMMGKDFYNSNFRIP